MTQGHTGVGEAWRQNQLLHRISTTARSVCVLCSNSLPTFKNKNIPHQTHKCQASFEDLATQACVPGWRAWAALEGVCAVSSPYSPPCPLTALPLRPGRTNHLSTH
jgi:hypothetical protein